jgi:hypothetical protein
MFENEGERGIMSAHLDNYNFPLWKIYYGRYRMAIEEWYRSLGDGTQHRTFDEDIVRRAEDGVFYNPWRGQNLGQPRDSPHDIPDINDVATLVAMKRELVQANYGRDSTEIKDAVAGVAAYLKAKRMIQGD